MDYSDLLAWAPYLIIGVLLMTVKPGRWLIKMVFVAAFAIIALLAFSEPDLRG